jgi:hypothetical protein
MNWTRREQQRSEWKALGETFVQQWPENGSKEKILYCRIILKLKCLTTLRYLLKTILYKSTIIKNVRIL